MTWIDVTGLLNKPPFSLALFFEASIRRIFATNTSIKPEANILKPTSAPVNVLKTPLILEQIVHNLKKSSESCRFRTRYKAYESTVLRLAKAQQYSMIIEILDAQKQYKEISSEGFVVRLISLYGKAGMFDHAQALFDEMPQLKCQRTVMSFHALLSACVNAKKFNRVEGIFRERPSKLSIEPDVQSYNTVIGAFSEMGSVDSVYSMLEEMEKNGVEPNVVTFTTLLEGFFKNDRYAEGEKIWALMQSRNIAPNIFSYNARLRGMVRDNRISEAVDLIDEMKLKEMKPDLRSFNALIKVSCKNGRMEEAKNWYEELLKNEFVPNQSTYLTLIPFVCEEDDYDMALKLCTAAISDQLLINVQDVKRVIDGLVDKGMMVDAKKLVGLVKTKFKVDLALDQNEN